MFLLKKVIGVLLSPLGVVLWLALLAVLLRVAQRHRAAKWVGIGAAIFAWLVSTPLVGRWLLSPLESRYPPLQGSPPAEVRYIFVLGSSYMPLGHLPITASIDESGFRRAVEGIRLQRLVPAAKLVFSGGAIPPGGAPADGNALLAEQLGVPADSILKLLKPLDTRSEAMEVCRLSGNNRIVVVTSAAHMPRAMEYMHRAGCLPIPAPTGHRSGPSGLQWMQVFPNANGLRMSEDAFHEYLGWIDVYLHEKDEGKGV